MSNETEKTDEPGPWGPTLLTALQAAGVVPAYAQHVIIDIPNDGFVMIHTVHSQQSGNLVIDVLPALLKDAQITVHEKEATL